MNKRHKYNHANRYYLVTKYTPQIMTKIGMEKPSATTLIWNFVESVDSSGTLIMPEKQMAKVLGLDFRTVYSDIKYLNDNDYIGVGSTGGNTRDVFVLNPSIFWFPHAMYNRKNYLKLVHKKEYLAFPSAVTLGKQHNHKFYQVVRNFHNLACKNMVKDPIFSLHVQKIFRNKNKNITIKVSPDQTPIVQALYSVIYMHLSKQASNVVKYVFTKLEEHDGSICFSNKDILKGMKKKKLQASRATIARTMSKLSKNKVIDRSRKYISFSSKYYRTKREHHVRANNIRHLKIQKHKEEQKISRKINAKKTRKKLQRMNKKEESIRNRKKHLEKILEEQKDIKIGIKK